MKKMFKKIISILILVMLILSLRIQANTTENNKDYKVRTVNIGGLLMSYNDIEFFNGENNSTTDEEKRNNNIFVAIIGVGLVIYWIVLLIIFEKEEPYYYYHRDNDDIDTLRKYNPMLAGCLVDNRNVLARDITAVIVSLIQKEVINMKMIPNMKGKETYKYIISENRLSTAKLDETEKYVLNWIFGFYEQDEVDLIEKLKELSKRKDFLKHLKKLDKITQTELNKMGANINKVPFVLRIFNDFLVLFAIMLTLVHVINNGINIHIYGTTMMNILIIITGIILIIPVVAVIIHIILILVVLIKKSIKMKIEENNGKLIISNSILILIGISIFILLVYIIVPNKYICLDIFIIGMTILIVKTDNLMIKHDKKIMHDYYALQEIKYKIAEYSLIKDEQINYIKLWEEYLVYAIAFGIPIQIVDKLKTKYKEDEDIEYLLKCENLYYICKAYLEVMWEMEFKEKKPSIVNELFKKVLGR